jgi:hypothetical protein
MITDLRGVDFSGQDLAGMDFTGCDLRNADLRGAKLAGAVFVDAWLRGTLLDGADFVGADLAGARLPEIRLQVAGWQVRIRRNGSISVGCVARTAEQWAETGAEDIAALTPQPDAPADFVAARDAVLAASRALRGLYANP